MTIKVNFYRSQIQIELFIEVNYNHSNKKLPYSETRRPVDIRVNFTPHDPEGNIYRSK
jgi:hypothetical protein